MGSWCPENRDNVLHTDLQKQRAVVQRRFRYGSLEVKEPRYSTGARQTWHECRRTRQAAQRVKPLRECREESSRDIRNGLSVAERYLSRARCVAAMRLGRLQRNHGARRAAHLHRQIAAQHPAEGDGKGAIARDANRVTICDRGAVVDTFDVAGPIDSAGQTAPWLRESDSPSASQTESIFTASPQSFCLR